MLFDRVVSPITRALGRLPVPGLWRLWEPLRRRAIARFRGREERWIDVRPRRGLVVRVDRSSYIGSMIYWRSAHSRDEMRALKRLLRAGMVVADVGANQGEIALFAAQRVGPSGRVLAFEPVPALNLLVREHAERNALSHVTVCPIALGDEEGTLELFEPGAAVADGASHDELTTAYARSAADVLVATARVRRFDDVVAEEALERLDVIKIDAEGGELAILRGALESLERFRPHILFELNQPTYAAAGYAPRDVLDVLSPLGYTFRRVGRVGRLTTLDVQDPPGLCNVLATPTNAPS